MYGIELDIKPIDIRPCPDLVSVLYRESVSAANALADSSTTLYVNQTAREYVHSEDGMRALLKAWLLVRPIPGEERLDPTDDSPGRWSREDHIVQLRATPELSELRRHACHNYTDVGVDDSDVDLEPLQALYDQRSNPSTVVGMKRVMELYHGMSLGG